MGMCEIRFLFYKKIHLDYIFSLGTVATAAAAKSLQSCPTLCDPHRQQPMRLLRPWDFPGKSTRVGCHCLLWGTVGVTIKVMVVLKECIVEE